MSDPLSSALELLQALQREGVRVQTDPPRFSGKPSPALLRALQEQREMVLALSGILGPDFSPVEELEMGPELTPDLLSPGL